MLTPNKIKNVINILHKRSFNTDLLCSYKILGIWGLSTENNKLSVHSRGGNVALTINYVIILVKIFSTRIKQWQSLPLTPWGINDSIYDLEGLLDLLK